MVRFHQGKPTGIYYSQHEDGAAYSWAGAKLSLQDERVSRPLASRTAHYYQLPILGVVLTGSSSC